MATSRPSSRRPHLHGTGVRALAPLATCIRLSHHQSDLMARIDEQVEGRKCHLGGSGKDQAHGFHRRRGLGARNRVHPEEQGRRRGGRAFDGDGRARLAQRRASRRGSPGPTRPSASRAEVVGRTAGGSRQRRRSASAGPSKTRCSPVGRQAQLLALREILGARLPAIPRDECAAYRLGQLAHHAHGAARGTRVPPRLRRSSTGARSRTRLPALRPH